MAKLYGKGHEILSLFNVEYPNELTDILMNDPNARFRLSLERAPLKKKKK